jgi:hypothetical protein
MIMVVVLVVVAGVVMIAAVDSGAKVVAKGSGLVSVFAEPPVGASVVEADDAVRNGAAEVTPNVSNGLLSPISGGAVVTIVVADDDSSSGKGVVASSSSRSEAVVGEIGEGVEMCSSVASARVACASRAAVEFAPSYFSSRSSRQARSSADPQLWLTCSRSVTISLQFAASSSSMHCNNLPTGCVQFGGTSQGVFWKQARLDGGRSCKHPHFAIANLESVVGGAAVVAVKDGVGVVLGPKSIAVGSGCFAGHAPTLQGTVSVSSAQWAALESATIKRCRVLVPESQFAEHSSQSSHGESTQSAGQSCVLQLCSSRSKSSSTSHDPSLSACETPRVLVRIPPPQICVQFDQALQDESVQPPIGAAVVETTSSGAVVPVGSAYLSSS